MVSVAYDQERIQRGRMRDMHPPTRDFFKCFDVYDFSIISNLFDSDKPYALTTHNRKCANKMHHIWLSSLLRIRFEKFQQSLPKNYSKGTKITITACKFSKIFRGSMPADPLEPPLFLNRLQISSAEKMRSKK